MSDLGSRLAGVFLAPAPKAGRVPETPEPAPALVRGPQIAAVLAAPGDLDAAAGAVAAALRRAASARTAVVCRPWAGACDAADPDLLVAPPARIATPSAARLARKLLARDLAAAPAGAVCRVGVPGEPGPVTRDLWRIAGAVDVPIVLALPGRLEGFDDVLAQLDRLVLAAPADADPVLAALALDSLATLGPVATRTVPPSGVLARRLAAAGLVAITLDAAAVTVDVETPSATPARGSAEPAFEPPRAEVRA